MNYPAEQRPQLRRSLLSLGSWVGLTIDAQALINALDDLNDADEREAKLLKLSEESSVAYDLMIAKLKNELGDALFEIEQLREECERLKENQ
jgi:hypothetical protein